MSRRTRGFARLVLALASATAACEEPVDRFARPTGVAFGSNGDVFVADGYEHSRVVRFDEEGRFVAAWGERGVGPGQLEVPHGIAADGRGRVYVADRANARVQVFDEDGGVVDVWDDPSLGRPWHVALAPNGRVWVLDGGDQDPERPRTRVLELSAEGELLSVFDASVGDPPIVHTGHALAIGADGSVYVADLEGQRVVKLGVRR